MPPFERRLTPKPDYTPVEAYESSGETLTANWRIWQGAEVAAAAAATVTARAGRDVPWGGTALPEDGVEAVNRYDVFEAACRSSSDESRTCRRFVPRRRQTEQAALGRTKLRSCKALRIRSSTAGSHRCGGSGNSCISLMVKQSLRYECGYAPHRRSSRRAGSTGFENTGRSLQQKQSTAQTSVLGSRGRWPYGHKMNRRAI